MWTGGTQHISPAGVLCTGSTGCERRTDASWSLGRTRERVARKRCGSDDGHRPTLSHGRDPPAVRRMPQGVHPAVCRSRHGPARTTPSNAAGMACGCAGTRSGERGIATTARGVGMLDRRCGLCIHWRASDPRGGAWHRPGDGSASALSEPRRSGTAAGDASRSSGGRRG